MDIESIVKIFNLSFNFLSVIKRFQNLHDNTYIQILDLRQVLISSMVAHRIS